MELVLTLWHTKKREASSKMLYWFLTHLNLVERVITWRGWQKITDQALGKPGLDSFFFFSKASRYVRGEVQD